MKTNYTIAYVLALVFGVTALLNVAPVHSSSGDGHKAPAVRRDLARVKESYSRIPLSFVANQGQADKQVKFTSRGSGYSLALTPTTFTLAVAQPRRFGRGRRSPTRWRELDSSSPYGVSPDRQRAQCASPARPGALGARRLDGWLPSSAR